MIAFSLFFNVFEVPLLHIFFPFHSNLSCYEIHLLLLIYVNRLLIEGLLAEVILSYYYHMNSTYLISSTWRTSCTMLLSELSSWSGLRISCLIERCEDLWYLVALSEYYYYYYSGFHTGSIAIYFIYKSRWSQYFDFICRWCFFGLKFKVKFWMEKFKFWFQSNGLVVNLNEINFLNFN